MMETISTRIGKKTFSIFVYLIHLIVKCIWDNRFYGLSTRDCINDKTNQTFLVHLDNELFTNKS